MLEKDVIQYRSVGKYFLAKSQRYELCSDKCRKAQAFKTSGNLTRGQRK